MMDSDTKRDSPEDAAAARRAQIVDACAREARMMALRYEGEEKPVCWLDESEETKEKWRSIARVVLNARSAILLAERSIQKSMHAKHPFWRRWLRG